MDLPTVTIKAIIFDLGGVVLSRGLWSFREYLTQKYGVTDQQTRDVIIGKYYGYFKGGISEQDFWNGVLTDLNISADWQELKKVLLDFYVPQDGMFELVRQIQDQGYRVYLLSDQTKDWWPALDAKYKISQRFDKTFVSAELGMHKPDTEIYQYVLDHINESAEEVIIMDDLEQNLPAAKALGMNTYFFTDVPTLKKDLYYFSSISRF